MTGGGGGLTMAMIRCPYCDEETFTITGWADLDHCASCGRPLGERTIEIGAALDAMRRFARPPQHAQPRPQKASKTSKRGGR